LIAEQLQSHYKENIHIFDGISEFNMNNLKQSVIGAFNTWKSKSDGIEMNISKSGSLKYSEHIFAKNHYVADMM
jgi:hypothetical protein